MVHSGLINIGKLQKESKSEVLGNEIINTLVTLIYPGTLIFPTYTYSFCKNEDYNPDKTLSTIGSLTNIFWQRKDSRRSSHPIFSIAAIGKSAKYFTSIGKKVCLGNSSFFDKLVKKNVKILGFGIKLIPALTLLHHIEEIAAVPYRFYKLFPGHIVENDHKAFQKYSYYVRKLELNPELNLIKIEKLLKKHNLIYSTKLGGGIIEVIESGPVFTLLLSKLKHDPYWMLMK